RREPIPGGLSAASLLRTVPGRHTRQRPLALEGYSSSNRGSLRVRIMFGGAGWGSSLRDCLQQGCCSQAYRDVFTACPGESCPNLTLAPKSKLSRGLT